MRSSESFLEALCEPKLVLVVCLMLSLIGFAVSFEIAAARQQAKPPVAPLHEDEGGR